MSKRKLAALVVLVAACSAVGCLVGTALVQPSIVIDGVREFIRFKPEEQKQPPLPRHILSASVRLRGDGRLPIV